MELYIHIPFCVRKCYYCDFLSFPCGEDCSAGNIAEYTDALCGELEMLADKYADREFTSAFIGGGTPSVLPVEQMERILIAAARLMRKTPKEYTIECNPGTVTAKKLALYRKYGVNRISFGLQSVNDDELKLLGRIHDYGQFCESYRMAREAGFDNINVDLISAIPGQTVSSWERTLRTVAQKRPEHISAYSLIIEPGTRFWELYGEERTDTAAPEQSLPDEDSEREMYRITSRVLAEYGFGRYEISNYSLPGYESAHNLGYWTGEEYIGAGLGASSYIREGVEMIRYKNTEDMHEYVSACRTGAIEGQQTIEERLDREEQMSEYMILHLRLTKGADCDEFERRFGVPLTQKYSGIIDKYIAMGLLRLEEGHLGLTEKGFDVSNIIMADFLP